MNIEDSVLKMIQESDTEFEEILEMSIIAILTKFLIRKKRLIKNSPRLASQKKGVMPNKSDNF